MNFIFYGFLVSLFGGLDINQVSIGPLFSIGAYFLIQKGVLSLDRENPFFKKVPTLLYVLMGLSALSFVFGATRTTGLSGLIGLATFVIDIIVIYNVIKGIELYSDVLIDKRQPRKLFKRWRIQYILGGVWLVFSIVLGIVAIASVSWATMAEFVQALQATGGTDQAAIQTIITNYMSILQPVIVIVFVWIFTTLVIAISLLVFKILFLVSMYRIQADYQVYLLTPVSPETPTQI